MHPLSDLEICLLCRSLKVFPRTHHGWTCAQPNGYSGLLFRSQRSSNPLVRGVHRGWSPSIDQELLLVDRQRLRRVLWTACCPHRSFQPSFGSAILRVWLHSGCLVSKPAAIQAAQPHRSTSRCVIRPEQKCYSASSATSREAQFLCVRCPRSSRIPSLSCFWSPCLPIPRMLRKTAALPVLREIRRPRLLIKRSLGRHSTEAVLQPADGRQGG
jgi:hypothetical protein